MSREGHGKGCHATERGQGKTENCSKGKDLEWSRS